MTKNNKNRNNLRSTEQKYLMHGSSERGRRRRHTMLADTSMLRRPRRCKAPTIAELGSEGWRIEIFQRERRPQGFFAGISRRVSVPARSAFCHGSECHQTFRNYGKKNSRCNADYILFVKSVRHLMSTVRPFSFSSRIFSLRL